MTHYEDYCPNCEQEVSFRRIEGATIGLTCSNCRKTWAAPMLDEAQSLDPNYDG